jgi:hypothetical protein
MSLFLCKITVSKAHFFYQISGKIYKINNYRRARFKACVNSLIQSTHLALDVTEQREGKRRCTTCA